MKNVIQVSDVFFSVTFTMLPPSKSSKNPCRALLNPLDEQTGNPITKRQLYDKDSDYPINKTVYGKNPKDILENHIPKVASELIVKMKECGLLSSAVSSSESTVDLKFLAMQFKETFFAIHKNDWCNSTIRDYQGQFDILVEELKDVFPEDVTQDMYVELQKRICEKALQTSKKSAQWKFGDAAPASAQKRTNLLFLLLNDLKTIEGCCVPATPIRYQGKISRQDELLARIDSARSFPGEVISLMRESSPNFMGQPGLLLDCGLRISENAGLLNCSIDVLNGSQGPQYYLQITGQIRDTGKRTEITKTHASYRIVPISFELGQRLHNICNTGNRLDLMCVPQNQALLPGSAESNARAYLNRMSTEIPAFFEQEEVRSLLSDQRAYTFSPNSQEHHLSAYLTCHSLRRNFCTWLYCESGLNTDEIYRQMGHANKSQNKGRRMYGLNTQEIYSLCLKKYVSHTFYHEAHALSYHVDSIYTKTEVPACDINLSIPANSTVQIEIEDTEVGNVTQILSDSLQWNVERTELNRHNTVSYALLARKETYKIVASYKLFH